MKANSKQNAVKLTASKSNRANRKQTEEITALVKYSSVHEVHMKL